MPFSVQAANAESTLLLKPMAITLKQADEIIEATEKNNVKVSVISQMRFAPAVKILRLLMIISGQIGFRRYVYEVLQNTGIL